MAIRIKDNSRLKFGDLRNIDGIEFWSITDLPAIPARSDDIRYQVLENDRIDLIAYKFYGDPVLWWVIAVANNLELIPTEISPGMTLRIPSTSYVKQQLFKTATTR
jgi:hypothetical protein